MIYEKNVPTKQNQKKEVSRIPCSNGNKSWKKNSCKKETERTSRTICVNNNFTKEMHIRKKWEFSSIRKHGQKFYGDALCFQYTQSNYSKSKLGITASKKFGNAVKRNLFKRRVREVFRKVNSNLTTSVNLNILPLRKNKDPDYSDYENDFMKFLGHLQKGQQ